MDTGFHRTFTRQLLAIFLHAALVLVLVSEIFRDRTDRSLVVLALVKDSIMVEYANGEVARVTDRQWTDLIPTPAKF